MNKPTNPVPSREVFGLKQSFPHECIPSFDSQGWLDSTRMKKVRVARQPTRVLAIRFRKSVRPNLEELVRYHGARNRSELVRRFVLDSILDIHNTAAFRTWKVNQLSNKKMDVSQGRLLVS